MGSGALIELIAKGKQDVYIIGNPQISFFKTVYNRHTNFSIEPRRNNFYTTPNFGTRNVCYIDKKADLVNTLYLEIELPALEENISWVNGIGNLIIKKVELQIGGETIDEITGKSLDVYQELVVPYGLKNSYYEMVGKKFTYTKNSQTDALLLFVPLPFWFCRDISRSLPLINLAYTDVSVVVHFEEFDNLWYKKYSPNWVPAEPKNIISCYLLTNYIYLDVYERRKLLGTKRREFLIEQFQESLPFPILTGQQSVSENVFLNHPVKEIIWYYQSFQAESVNDVSNFSNILNFQNPITETYVEPFTTIQLKYNGNDRFPELAAKYFRTVQPFEKHTSSPRSFVYIFSFAINPEVNQPSGTCNFSKIDDAKFNIGLTPNIFQGQIFILAINYNVLRIQEGQAGVLFSS